MPLSSLIILWLLLLTALALALGVWAARRTHNAADFVIASRRLGVWLTALGYSANAFSAWMLLLLSAVAFVWGAAAVWLWAAALFGGVINLFYVAPRLRAAAVGQNAVSFLQVVSADAGDRLHTLIVRSAVFIVIVLLLLQIGAVLHGAFAALSAELNWSIRPGVVLSATVTGVCLLAGGLRAAAAMEAAQGAVLFAIALLLLASALVAIGGWESLQIAVAALEPEWKDPFAGKHGVVAVAFAGGGLGLGLAAVGQPQVLQRFIAARDEATLRRARWVALAWMAALSAVVLLGGWAAHLLYAGLESPERSLFALALRLPPPWLSAALTAGLAAGAASSMAGPLLAIATSAAVDLRRSGAPLSLAWMKATLFLAAASAASISLLAPAPLLDRALFAFTTLGASLGPLVLVRLSGKRIRPGSMLGAMWSGLALSLLFHLLPDSPGDFLERVLPFVASLGVALSGGERRRNPDRADRAQETVHDRAPI